MNNLIYFRTKIESHHMSEYGKRVKGQSLDISGIRWYIPGDDPRDILWKKASGSGNIYSRDRSGTSHPTVTFVSLIDGASLDFCTDAYPQTKSTYIHELESIIRESARQLHFPYQSKRHISWSQNTAKHTILIILWDIDSIDRSREYFPYSKYNDVIFLFLLHPVELSVEKQMTMIFESWQISDTYQEALRAYMHGWRSEFSDHRIAFLPCSTQDEPVLLLNHFFKYRYA